MIYHPPSHMHEFANPASQLIVNVSTGKYHTDIDQASINRMNKIIAEIGKHKDLKNGNLIDFISKQFLGTPYVANRLIGSQTTPEHLVIDLNALDCFTYIDYVEAFRRAKMHRTSFGKSRMSDTKMTPSALSNAVTFSQIGLTAIQFS